MSWAVLWDKRRIRISQLGGIALILIARPRSPAFSLAGLVLIAMGEALRIWAAGHIRKGDVLARQGPYAMVRHPLYLGSFTLACGFALMCTSRTFWVSSVVLWAAILCTFYWLYGVKIKMEEGDLKQFFGPEFEAYRREVPPLWPAWNRWRAARRTSAFSWKQAVRNHERQTLWACVGLAVLLRFKMIYLR